MGREIALNCLRLRGWVVRIYERDVELIHLISRRLQLVLRTFATLRQGRVGRLAVDTEQVMNPCLHRLGPARLSRCERVFTHIRKGAIGLPTCEPGIHEDDGDPSRRRLFDQRIERG